MNCMPIHASTFLPFTMLQTKIVTDVCLYPVKFNSMKILYVYMSKRSTNVNEK